MFEFSRNKTYAVFQSPPNKKLIAEIEKSGANSILLPPIETSDFYEQNETLTATVENFDWLIFTDFYAVEYFLQKLESENFDFFNLDKFRVCAFGETVADRLRYAQLHADVVSANLKPDTILNDLKNYLFDDAEFARTDFLMFKEHAAIVPLTDKIRNLGAKVSEISIYRIASGENAEIAKLKTLLRGGAADEFIFSSPHDVLNLAHYFPNENLTDVLEGTKILCSDDVTRRSLEEFRLI